MTRIPTDLTPTTVLKEVVEPLQQNVVTGEIYAKVDSTDNKGWAKFVTNNIKSVFNYDSSVSLPAITSPTTIVNKAYVDSKLSAISKTVPLAKLTVGGANGSITIVAGVITAVVDPT